MQQVSDQAGLLAAIRAQEPDIQVIADFPVTSQISIGYEVSISSPAATTIFTIRKDTSYFSYMFRINEGGNLHLSNIILDGDSANHPADNTTNRSLLYVTGGALSLGTGTTLQNNNSYGEGGGVYVSGKDTYTNSLIINGNARITGCNSRTNGGAVSLAPGGTQDEFKISEQASFDNNTAANGGGIYFRSYIEGVGGTLALTDDVQIANNTASSTGGGICFSGFRTGGNAPADLNISSSVTISGNQAVHGGGIYFYSANDGDRMDISESPIITENTASGNGGGICMIATTGSADLTLTDTGLTKNIGGTGGGIYLLTDAGGALTISRSDISENEALNGASGNGGGIWLQNRSADRPTILQLSNSTVGNNESSAQGGGMAVFGGPGNYSFRVNQSTISNNRSDGNGGGILMSSTGESMVDVQESTIANNTSGGSGGGFYYGSNSSNPAAQATLGNVSMIGNIANNEGGAIRFSSGQGALTTTITNCTIANNTARTNSGGGIWNGGPANELSLYGTTTVTGNSSEEGNGGGIYFNSTNGTLLLTDSTKIEYNHADSRASDFGNHGGGVCVVPGNITINAQAEISFNSALKYGGGISAAEQSNITMTNGSIHDNQSSQVGGGVWVHDSSMFSMNGGSLYNNTAQYGGGIYNDFSTVSITGNAAFGIPALNTATTLAPGIYNSGTLYTDGTRDISNGVYIVNRTSVVYLPAALTDSSIIQLDNSDYVSPNASGTPIVVGEATAQYPVLSQTDADAFRKPPKEFEYWEILLSNDSTQVLLVPITYTIHYENLLGAVHPNPGSYSVTTPTITLAAPESIPGYQFIGWFNEPMGGNQVTQIPQGSTGDITLYARWEVVNHTIYFDGNDECGAKAKCVPDPIMLQDGQCTTVPMKKPCKRRCCFIEWNTDSCGDGISYLPGDFICDLTDDITLYAIWKTKRFF